MSGVFTRRSLLSAGAAGAGGLLLGGCDRLDGDPAWRHLLGLAEPLHMGAQRLLIGRGALAPEFTAAQLSPVFRTNGNTQPDTGEWQAQAASGFAQWRLLIDGLVRRPLALPLAALQALPQRSQITRHDCVEGWSAIGQWQGPRLAAVLDMAGLQPAARYLVFHCADRFGGSPYYESIDLIDAYHPQTILAWRMNGAPLAIGHGAPVRLRVERQLGYKHAKYVMRIEARDSLSGLYGGKGGYWEDAAGYQWYAGI
ncbi:MAG: molybdopterin-dependent oxidoreductase [Novosphingobium sp.]|nr:molybdopterin-dependent oxidoreductase [Novosphingobium sp.]